MRKVCWLAMLTLGALLIASGCGGSDKKRGSGNGGKGKKASPVTVGSASSCDLPTVNDRYVGFKVGRPEGWTLDSTGGAIIVKEDPKGKTLALVYPVVLNKGQTVRSLFDRYSQTLQATATAAGEDLRFTAAKHEGKALDSTVSGSFGGASVRGRAKVSRAGRQTVFAAYWAPTDQIQSEEETLSAIVSCYEQQRGTTLKVRDGQFFTLVIPPDWNVTGETENGIDVGAPNREAGVSLAYVVNSAGSATPKEFRDFTFDSAKIGDLQITARQDLGGQTDQLGTSWQLQASEFRGVFEGKDVRGVVTVAVGNGGYGTYSAMSSIRIAEVNEWDKLAGVLAAIQDSIKIKAGTNPGAGVNLPANRPLEDPLSGSAEYRDQVNDKLSQDWQETTMGFDNVESPSTGEKYQAPLNSYNPTGPDGPGYYRSLPGGGGSEKLQESAP